jgi:hypothetical protein
MEKMQRYLDAFTKASDRTRGTYVIILAFSVVCLAAFLNSSDFGWHRRRQHKLRVAYAYLLWQEKQSDGRSTSHGTSGRHALSAQRSIRPAIPDTSGDPGVKPAVAEPETTLQAESHLSPREVEEAKEYVELTRLWTSDQMKIVLQNTEKQVSDSNVVQIPLFGLSFHLNDLGLVSGIALLLLVLLLKYALTREVGNLALAFDRARELGVLDDAYEALSTNEVLHRPEALSATGPDWLSERKRKILFRPLIDAPVVLLFVPVVSYTLVTANDFLTWRTGILLSPVYARVILVVEFAAWSAITFLILSCLVIILETRRLWRDVERDARAMREAKKKPALSAPNRSRLRAESRREVARSFRIRKRSVSAGNNREA